jgi:RHS repeat-associated protein
LRGVAAAPEWGDVDAYGRVIDATGQRSDIGYTGALRDSETGLVYLRARDYDPGTRQFLSVDPAIGSTLQPYAYVGNSPLTRTDPLGLFGMEDVGRWFDDPNAGLYHALTEGPGANVTSFLVGFGDGASFGLSAFIREAISPGSSCTVAQDGFYSAAQIAGAIATSLLPIPGAAILGAATKVATQVTRVIPAAVRDSKILTQLGTIVTGVRTGIGTAVKNATTAITNQVAHVSQRLSNLAGNAAVKTAGGATPDAASLVRYSSQWASRSLLRQAGDGYAATAGGRSVSAHAADRIVNGGGGRPPTTLTRVDDILDNPTALKYDPLRDTVKISQGRAYVVVGGTGPQHVVTVMIPR